MKSSMKQDLRVGVRLCLVAGVLVGLISSMSGCYREVISAEGIGADETYTRRARSSETKIDKAIDDVFREIEE